MLTIERANHALSYCAETGEFRWKIRVGRMRPIGSLAGKLDKDGYRVIGLDGRKYRAGRLAYFMATGSWPDCQIDHINGEKSDDRLQNLRPVTQTQNSQNTSFHKNSVSKKKGVDYHKGDCMWRARIRVNGKRLFLGNFHSPEEAHYAYCRAAAKLHGEFARTS